MKNDAAQRRLLDRLRPDPVRTGRLLRILATTHDLQAEFFDGDFLATALAISEADLTGRSGQMVLQRRLAELDFVGVLSEGSAYVDRPSLRTLVYPVRLPGGVLHAKLLVLHYEHAVRIIVGSANLTEPAYRHNREVVGEQYASANDPGASARAAALLQQAFETLGSFRDRASEFLNQMSVVGRILRNWAGDVQAESPVIWSGPGRRLVEQLLARLTDGERVRELLIVSPFWSEDGTADAPLRRLLARLAERGALAPSCNVELISEGHVLPSGEIAPVEQLKSLRPEMSGVTITQSGVDPRVDPNDLDVKIELTQSRRLHAKLFVAVTDRGALVYAGSANFTRRGFGLLAQAAWSNVEAGWFFVCPAATAVVLLPPRGPTSPVPLLDEPAVVSDDGEINASDHFWPDALLCADLVPHTVVEGGAQQLVLETRWALPVPPDWQVLAGFSNDDVASDRAPRRLFTTSSSSGSIERTILDEDSLKLLLQNRCLTVVGCGGCAQFPVNLDEVARFQLPLSSSSVRPSELDLLAYYQGKVTLEDLYPSLDEADGRDSLVAGQASGVMVERMKIQAYQVRAFVDALVGLERELREVHGSRGRLFQAFRGEVSPVALARFVRNQVERGDRSPTAGAFQLTELLALLGRVQQSAPSDDEHYIESCSEARREVEVELNLVRLLHPLTFESKGMVAYQRRLCEVAQ